MEILFCGSGWLDIVDLIAARLPPGDRLRRWTRDRPLADEVTAAPPEVLLPSNGRVDAAVIEAAAARGLRLIQQPATGVDAIDLAAAAAHGIPVCNAPGANQVAVAEAALLLLLLCARRWPVARERFVHGVIGAPLGVELAGSRLVVIGGGRTGGALASRARALAMEVQVLGSATTRAGLLAALAAADAVSLHCPLTPRTRGLIDAEALAALPAHAIVVNVARGPIVDRAALEAALARGHLGGVGLDVFWQEPWDPRDPLFAHPKVVTLPHVGGSTVGAFTGIAGVVIENLARLRRGEPLLHRVA
ncbi:MAG TPA: NAD(P)-dependent oxidoreductase [Kofleriaceae bacterium]|nr:NAD(P)-dependent oxidoreductase [Kofleriaceae bacterium]